MEWKIDTRRSDGQPEIFYSNFTLEGVKNIIKYVGNTIEKIYIIQDGLEIEYVEDNSVLTQGPFIKKKRKKFLLFI